MKTKISTSIKLIVGVLLSSLLFTQTKAQPSGNNCSANFNYQTGIAGGCTAYFTDLSTGTSSMTTYSWDFGDGNSSSTQNPTHTYSASGTYSACLAIFVKNTNGPNCYDTLCQNVTVQCGGASTPCTANWQSQADLSNPCIINFTDGSLGTTWGTMYNWSFGNGQTSTTQNPSQTYTASGTYNVCLTITVPSSSGTPCIDSLCKNVTVQCGNGNTAVPYLDGPDFWLSINNPVFSSSEIRYFLPATGTMELALYDVVGNKISVLENGNKNTGAHSYFLDTADFSKGIYFVRLNLEGKTITKKIIVG